MKTKILKKSLSSVIISSVLFWQAFANPDGCVIWVSWIWQCHIWYSATNVVNSSSSNYTPTASSWSVTFDSWVNNVNVGTNYVVQLTSWLTDASATTTTVWGTSIQAALNAKKSWWFNWSTVKMVTLNSWIQWTDITLTAWSWSTAKSAVIKDGTKVFASPSWSWNFKPSTKKTWLTRSWYTTIDGLEVWDSSETLVLDQVMKLTELDWASASAIVAYSNDGWSTWTDMTTACNSATNPTNITFPGECYYKDSGTNKTLIYTYHATDYWIFVPVETWTWWSVLWWTWQVMTNIKILAWQVDIGAPSSLTFPSMTVRSYVQTWTIASDENFWIEDLKSSPTWYQTSLMIWNLTADNSKTISSEKLSVTAWTISTMSWSTNANTILNSSNWISSSYIWFSSPQAFIERTTDTGYDWVVWTYWSKPTIQIIVPAYQSIWLYTWRITYDLSEL